MKTFTRIVVAGTATLALGAGVVAAPTVVPSMAPPADAHTYHFINSPHSDSSIQVWREHGCKGAMTFVGRGKKAPFKVGSFGISENWKVYMEAGPYNGLSSTRKKKWRCYDAWFAGKQVYNMDSPSPGHS